MAIVRIRDTTGRLAAGVKYPKTSDGWVYLYEHRLELGFDNSQVPAPFFSTVNGEICVDTTAWLDWLELHPGDPIWSHLVGL